MTILLFAGPSLHGLARPLPPGVVHRPPARAGDIAAAARERPHAIALVDGEFGRAPTVWHKELLDALDRGIAVLGAASLGALRAAECESLGMEGVGEVFAAARDGRLTRDDAVLVAHAPAELGWRPLSVALVDVEHSLARAPIDGDTRARLLQRARRMHFAERCWARLMANPAERADLWPRIRPFARSLKLIDVMTLLARLDLPLSAPPPADPPRLVETRRYRRLAAASMPAA